MGGIRASQEGREKFKQGREKKGFKQDADTLTNAISVSRSSVQGLEQGRRIRQDSFIALFKAVGIENWEAFVDNSPTQASYMEFSSYNEGWVGRETLVNELSNKVRGSCKVLILVVLQYLVC